MECKGDWCASVSLFCAEIALKWPFLFTSEDHFLNQIDVVVPVVVRGIVNNADDF